MGGGSPSTRQLNVAFSPRFTLTGLGFIMKAGASPSTSARKLKLASNLVDFENAPAYGSESYRHSLLPTFTAKTASGLERYNSSQKFCCKKHAKKKFQTFDSHSAFGPRLASLVAQHTRVHPPVLRKDLSQRQRPDVTLRCINEVLARFNLLLLQEPLCRGWWVALKAMFQEFKRSC